MRQKIHIALLQGHLVEFVLISIVVARADTDDKYLWIDSS